MGNAPTQVFGFFEGGPSKSEKYPVQPAGGVVGTQAPQPMEQSVTAHALPLLLLDEGPLVVLVADDPPFETPELVVVVVELPRAAVLELVTVV